MTLYTAYPIAPTTTPLRGTLLDVATLSTEFKWLSGESLFDSYNCMQFREDAVFCAPNEKEFDQEVSWQDGFKFAVYGGAICKAIGLDQARMESEVARVFRAGESTAVERALMEHRFVANAAGGLVPGEWAAPTDISPAAAVKPSVGIALLEGWMADHYVGVPTLHLPRVIASLVANEDTVDWKGDVLYTALESKVVAGAGYDYPNTGPTGAAAATGEKWIYATGEVLVIQGEPIIKQVMSNDTNEVFVLAERPYIVAVDCAVAAVKVTVST